MNYGKTITNTDYINNVFQNDINKRKKQNENQFKNNKRINEANEVKLNMYNLLNRKNTKDKYKYMLD